MQHVLEVRLKRRLFSFMDFRGRMVEVMTQSFGADKIKLGNNGTRFDLADSKIENVYFFGVANFGFQSELQTSLESFTAMVEKFTEALEGFSDYRISNGLVRIGTKSTILYHRRGDNLSTIKQAYLNLLRKSPDEFSELTGSKVVDTGYAFDVSLGENKASISTGPVSMEEAQRRVFQGTHAKEYANLFGKDNGMLLSIDVFSGGTAVAEITDVQALKKKINSQIGDIERIFLGLKKYITG